MVVFWVLVQNQATEFLHGKLRPWPDFCDIEGIEAKLVWISIFGLHDLNLRSPLNFLAPLNRLVEISLGVVGVLTTHLCGLFLRELFLAVLGNKVVLDVDELAIGIHPLKSMAAISMVKSPALRGSVITEEHETGMVTLRSASKQVEDAIVVEQKVFGVAVL